MITPQGIEEGQHPWRDPDDDRPRLECGVFGVFGVDEAAAVRVLSNGQKNLADGRLDPGPVHLVVL